MRRILYGKIFERTDKMNGELCSVCHKRIATVFITQIDNSGKQVNRGLCLVCAKKMKLPQVTQFLDKMGISDEDLETMTDGMEEGEVEHYFAKSAVPCLALHPFNLYFCCPTCNKRYKGDKSPFSGGKKELKRIFLPYLDTVRDQVRIGFEMDKKAGEEKVRLDPVDPKEEHIREKIRAFDHLFDLKKRWSGQLEGYYMEKMQWYRRKNPETVEALRAEMEEDIERGKSSLNISPRGYLETEYLEWLCSSQLKAFYSNMKQTDRTPVILGRTDS